MLWLPKYCPIESISKGLNGKIHFWARRRLHAMGSGKTPFYTALQQSWAKMWNKLCTFVSTSLVRHTKTIEKRFWKCNWEGWKHNSMIKGIRWSSGGPGVRLQDPHDGSQLSVILLPRVTVPSFCLHGNQACLRCPDIHADDSSICRKLKTNQKT